MFLASSRLCFAASSTEASSIKYLSAAPIRRSGGSKTKSRSSTARCFAMTSARSTAFTLTLNNGANKTATITATIVVNGVTYTVNCQVSS